MPAWRNNNVRGAERALAGRTMSDTSWLKLVEVGGLLAALLGFVWWQWRDLAQAKRDSAARRQRDGSSDAAPAGSKDERNSP
jgi:hypothetical protein